VVSGFADILDSITVFQGCFKKGTLAPCLRGADPFLKQSLGVAVGRSGQAADPELTDRPRWDQLNDGERADGLGGRTKQPRAHLPTGSGSVRGTSPMAATITVEEAQANLKAVIHQLAPGEEVMITEDQQPVARLVSEPPRPKPGLRPPPGLGKGRSGFSLT
jgi:antitoxin (DNA-binding transcriptional repressor) of toxin-antitoxin stability system